MDAAVVVLLSFCCCFFPFCSFLIYTNEMCLVLRARSVLAAVFWCRWCVNAVISEDQSERRPLGCLWPRRHNYMREEGEGIMCLWEIDSFGL